MSRILQLKGFTGKLCPWFEYTSNVVLGITVQCCIVKILYMDI